MRLVVFILIILFSPIEVLATPSSTEESILTQGLHLDWLNQSTNPGENFFEHANGGWQKNNPIPAAYARWGIFHVLQEQNQKLIKNLLESAAKNPNNKPGSIEQKVGDFYFSGMDEITINKVGLKPLQSEFNRINSIKTIMDLQKIITHLQMMGVNALFDFGQMQDFKDSRMVIGVASQGGLGLPDRDYYLKQEPKFQQIRVAYVQHMAKMFELLGDSKEKANIEANKVMNIETILAKASMSNIEQRNPHAIYHMMDIAELQRTLSDFSWMQFFADIHHPEIKQINLAMPNFFKVVNAQLKQTALDDWKIYLRWHLIHSVAPYVSQPFVNENFNMTKTLTGAQELLPRWQRVVNTEDHALGFAVGKIYVEKHFPASSKQKVQEIMKHVRIALKEDLKKLAWMTPKTREAAIKKLDMMEERIGYPDKWRDYSALKIDRGPYVINIMRASEFLNKRELNKIGKPVDRDEWDMTPQTVNAYYDPSMNRLNIPAGILQPPFFDQASPAAINYGGIGSVIGHEMTHGFDDEGAKFDGYGNLKNWWTAEDLKRFQVATQCISDQFSQYLVNGDIHVQGNLVKGEALADLGGVILAYRAFHNSQAQAKTLSGFTPDQQFFLGAAHVWATNIRPEEAQRLVIIDPHPPAIYRVNGTLANILEFQQAYGISDSSPMVKKRRCVNW